MDPIDGLIDKDRFIEEMYEQESWSSSASYQNLMICPSLRSYSSLDLLTCKDKDEEECRLVNLNNVIKKLFDTIDDPVKKQDVPFVCCLLDKLLKYNGNHGFVSLRLNYAKHLPQIGEILEFLAMQSKKVERYLDYLYQLLNLCGKPLLLERLSEILEVCSKLQRYFSLLGYLLVLAPTKASFDMVKSAIEVLVGRREDKTTRKYRTVKPDIRHEAVEQSRLPLTLTELTEVASTETYPAVLQLTHAVASVSRICCHRMLEAGIESRILIRLHPAYECEFECVPVTDQTNLLLDKEDYIGSAECAAKILCRLTSSLLYAESYSDKIASPTKPAMWSLRAALRRELLRARGSSRSRKLRNELANLILTGTTRCSAQWQLTDTGLIDDLADFFVASEYDITDGWAMCTSVEVNNITGLEFKKTLLALLARVVDLMPECVDLLKNKRIVSGLLQLIEPSKSTRIVWNSEQLWHLFKYATNALSYLAPKIPDEFIEDNGTLRLLLVLERLTTGDYDNTLVTCFSEMICSLSLANCDMITRHFRRQGFIPVLFKLIRRILDFEALALKHQRVIAYTLVASENILSVNDENSNDECCFCEMNIRVTIDLLQRCLHQKDQDSELDQSLLIAIGSFACKCVIHCDGSLRNFIMSGGLYQTLDIIERVNLPVQNLYLGLLTDISENEFSRRYMFSWRRSFNDKRHGILSLLANVWREEERIFGVERTQQGCILNTETPLLNDEQWLYVNYLKSACGDFDVLTTTAVGAVRPKIHHIIKLIKHHAERYRKDYVKRLFDELSTEDQITMLAVEAYADLKSDEASVEVLSRLKISPLTKSHVPLLPSASKLDLWTERSRELRERQEKLLEKSRVREANEELQTLERIRHAKLNPTFDLLAELSFATGASVRTYRLKKIEQMKTMKNQRTTCQKLVRTGPLFETCNFAANVTNVFDKQITVQSIPCPSRDTTIDEVSFISSLSTTRLSSANSHCSMKTDDTLALQNYKLDDNENVVLHFDAKQE